MAISKALYGTLPCGTEVYAYTMDNGKGLWAEVITYGGIITKLAAKDKNGKSVDVVLGHKNLEEYLNNDTFFGAAIGRHANRIAKGTFTLNGTEFHVGINEGPNSLHGGKIGFDQRVWDVTESGTEEEPALILTLLSPDGEEGFPGKVMVAMTYTLTADNAIKIRYEAISDKDTLVNLTNHSYFNLSGHNSGNIHDHVLKINADFFTPNDNECMPSGQVWMVKGTPFDFTSPKRVGDDINDDFSQVQAVGGYDHNFAIRGRGYREAAVVYNPANGIEMTVMTDKPAMQLYTGNGLKGDRICKDEAVYPAHSGLCLETQYFPNAMSHSHYPTPILKAGEKYDFTTEYRFCVK